MAAPCTYWLDVYFDELPQYLSLLTWMLPIGLTSTNIANARLGNDHPCSPLFLPYEVLGSWLGEGANMFWHYAATRIIWRVKAPAAVVALVEGRRREGGGRRTAAFWCENMIGLCHGKSPAVIGAAAIWAAKRPWYSPHTPSWTLRWLHRVPGMISLWRGRECFLYWYSLSSAW